MAISDDDLTIMAKIGAQKTSKDTYATIKLALEDSNAGFSDKNYSIFLQGSYGNDTNIYKESDVDVVIRLDSIFSYDIDSLPLDEKLAFQAVHPAAPYNHIHFRDDVLDLLYGRFGKDVKQGTKAITILPSNNRRKADVLIAIQHKKFRHYNAANKEAEIVGISFYKNDGSRVVNYPVQHRENLVAKNQNTNEWFKHIVRIYKNVRQKMIEEEIIEEGIAPSYYIEGLLSNVPIDKFGTSYKSSMVETINWLTNTDRSKFKCANNQYKLLDGNVDVTWNSKNCDAFLNGLVAFWNSR